ncbi:MAG: [FeFe] hydrogenase H-cluster radical SAM maturase HydG [Calditrichia bacterium]
MDFINEQLIDEVLNSPQNRDEGYQREVIAKAKDLKGLKMEETAALLHVTNPEIIQEMYKATDEVKEQIYGNRIVMFAPLYLTNKCVNNCLYCGFRVANKELKRVTLTIDDVREETLSLLRQGHKRVLLVCGEHPQAANLKFVGEVIDTIYNTKIRNGEIRRINVNTAPMSVEDFKVLKSFGIGTYQSFQETYHYDTYAKMHRSGPKKDYTYRLYTMDRAMEAGIDDVGMGILFGLYDHRWEVLAMMQHIEHLENRFDVGPHTISIPRLEPALNAPAAARPPHAIADEEFKKLVSILRLTVPYTGIILSTRERPEMRRQLFRLGVSQISAGSKTSPGGYHKGDLDDHPEVDQFQVADHRDLDEVIKELCDMGFLPSFCTACYRKGRTGVDFMDLAKPGLIKKFCTPNAISSFKEYLLDFASEETRASGEKAIERDLEGEPDNIRNTTHKLMNRVEKGERDVYF